MLEKHTPVPGINTVCKVAYVKHTALERSMEMDPGWFEAAITLRSDCESAFCLLAAWPSPMAVPTAAPGEGRPDGLSAPPVFWILVLLLSDLI